jgi:DNA-binding GntR family transcriptional regulator
MSRRRDLSVTPEAPPPRLLVHLTEPDLAKLISDGIANALRGQLSAAQPRLNQKLTIAQIEAEYPVSGRTIRRAIAAGRLRASRIASAGSSRVVVSRSDVEQLFGGAP